MYDDYEIKSLYIRLPKMKVYVKHYDDHNTIWEKVTANIKNEFDNEPPYKKFFFKTIIKSYSDEATDFHNKEIPKAGSNYTCLVVITIDSTLKNEENYYL